MVSRTAMGAIRSTLLAWLALLTPAAGSLAVDVPLPGERRLRLNGYYETRLDLAGDDAPLGDTSFSQFRHVLQLEAELLLFPEGVGPFDSVLLWTRFAASYECLYEHACGLVRSEDGYGGDRREARHLPASFGQGDRPRPDYVGGLHGRPITALPELTLDAALQEFSPRRGIRTCLDGPADFWRSNPSPYGVFCNPTARSPIGGPYHGIRGETEQPFYRYGRVHAGAFALPARYSLLRVARSRIGEARYAELLERLHDGRAGGLSAEQESLRRGLLRAGEREVAAALRSGTFDEAIPELLATRRDPNLFQVLAGELAPELLTARWGRERVSGVEIPFTPDLGLPIRPEGYFPGAALDLVSEVAEGVLAPLPPYAGIRQADFEEFARGSAYISKSEFESGALPLFVGPDGLSGTEDDLPSSRTGVTGLAEPMPRDSSFHNDFAFRYVHVGKVALAGEEIELYGVLDPVPLRRRACEFLTHRPAGKGDMPCTLEAAGVASLPDLERVGCRLAAEEQRSSRTMGFNADGHCIALNASRIADRGGVDPRVLVALGERRFRPREAALEPIDLTDFRLHAESQSSLPARPRARGGGLAFPTAGVERFRRRHRRSVANLELDASEADLRWNHGASDDEHEFREGYFELESIDRQLTTRLGKLIIVWGKTDIFRNLDRLNPLDLSGGAFQALEDARIGQWGAQFWVQPRSWLDLGPFEDVRLELAMLFDDFEADDLGRCGAPGALETACLIQASALAAGLSGVGVIGQTSPYQDHDFLERSEFGARLEGRFARFGFSISDFWGWDDTPLVRSVHAYDRRVDAVSGAPLTAGGSVCRWRGADGRPTNVRAESVGPDGIRGDDDDVIPSAGDCLLWRDAEAPGERQRLRAESAIADAHSVNQSLFHLMCALGFDPDEGFCAMDRLNSPQRFGQIMDVLGGGPLEPFAFRELGLDRIRMRGPDGDAAARERALLDFELVERGPPAFRAVNEAHNAGVDIYAETGLTPFQRASVGLEGAHQRPRGLGALSVEQGALLGCGPAYASPCNASERDDYTGDGGGPDIQPGVSMLGSLLLNARLSTAGRPASDGERLTAAHLGMKPEDFAPLAESHKLRIVRLDQGTIGASLERSPSQIGGGIDLMNADASVLLQENSILKAWAPGMFVGTRRTRGGLDWLPGINTQADGNASNDFRRSAFRLPGESAPLTAERALALSQDQRFRLSAAAFDAERIDGWIEPMPWQLDPAWAAKGVILFQADPRDPFGDPAAQALPASDPERAAKLVGKTRNRFNRLSDGTPYGEYCGTLSQSPEPGHPFGRGCTELEIISANLERLDMGADIVGPDREFDPPESIAELRTWIAHRNRLHEDEAAVGDPISGPDGIFARNFWADLVLDDPLAGASGQNDVQDVLAVRGARTGDGKGIFIAPLRPAELALPEAERAARRREFFRSYDPSSCPGAIRPCHLKLSLETAMDSGFGQGGDELVAALPISYVVDEAGQGGARRVRVNLLKLELERPLELARLFAGERVFDADSRRFVVMNPAQRQLLLGRGSQLLGAYQDLDGDELPDLDRDMDNVFDGQDDFTPGPITDDNVLCGSGIPGDIYQEALQFEPYRRSERPGTAKFAAAFVDGLPPRSPVFCSTASLLGATGSTLPMRRAGGDDRYGRIQFAWHDGQQVALDFQKTNVFGMGLDFSEDLTRSTWGIELSYASNREVADASDLDDLVSHTDELLASLSLDRSFFFNALNPGGTFLFNSQVFVRWLTDWREGYELHTPAAVTTFLTLSLQTSYMQGRAVPGVMLIALPNESQAGVMAELSYNWTDSISTTIGLTHLFGGPSTALGYYNPIGTGLSSPEDVRPTAWGRGLTSLLERDEVWLRFRFAW